MIITSFKKLSRVKSPYRGELLLDTGGYPENIAEDRYYDVDIGVGIYLKSSRNR